MFVPVQTATTLPALPTPEVHKTLNPVLFDTTVKPVAADGAAANASKFVAVMLKSEN